MLRSVVVCIIACLIAPAALAQSPPAPPPVLVALQGALRTADNAPRTGTVVLIVSLYDDEAATDPLWSEAQTMALDADGRYAIYAGATLADGIPQEHFLSRAGRWIGVAVQGEAEHSRARLLSVAYAAKAREADQLAGRAAADFVLQEDLVAAVRTELREGSGGGSSIGSSPGISASTVNVIPKFVDGSNTTGDSAMAEVSGNIGVGTSNPNAKLDVVASADSQHALDLTGLNTGTGLGGIYAIVSFLNTSTAVNTVTGFRFQHYNSASARRTSGAIESSLSNVTPGSEQGFLAFSTALNGASSERMRINGLGNVGIGTMWPSAKLHVAGDVVVDGNIGAKYQDVAEWVEAAAAIEAGTVVIVDPARDNHVVASARAYDTRVAGAVSRQPGVVLGERTATSALVAQSGRVRIKADAKYGAIRVGDLLVTSPTPGHAMRSRPMKIGDQSLHRPGTLLGKALEALPNGRGEILVLLTLQ